MNLIKSLKNKINWDEKWFNYAINYVINCYLDFLNFFQIFFKKS